MTNTLAYHAVVLITALKSVLLVQPSGFQRKLFSNFELNSKLSKMNLRPHQRANVIRLSFFVNYKRAKKLKCLSLAGFSNLV